MTDDIAAANAMALLDIGDEWDECRNLLIRKRPVAELMARIDDLDPDARAVDVGNPAPARFARVPGSLRFIHHPIDGTVFIHAVMGGYLRLRRGQAAKRAFAIGHSRVVKHNH